MEKFRDRQQAGQFLATQLQKYARKKDVIALALPRGGVPVAYEIANALSIPLELFIVRKIGAPQNKEFAIGAIASGGSALLDKPLIEQFNISKETIKKLVKQEKEELIRRESVYRGNKPFLSLKGKTILLIDDGIATGFTMQAAVLTLKQQKPAKIVIVVPVAPLDTYQKMQQLVDEIICPLRPQYFNAVSLWYESFPQVSDEELKELCSSREL